MGKRYIVTIIAYRDNKRSKVVETIFKTGLSVYATLLISVISKTIDDALVCFFFFHVSCILYISVL